MSSKTISKGEKKKNNNSNNCHNNTVKPAKMGTSISRTPV